MSGYARNYTKPPLDVPYTASVAVSRCDGRDMEDYGGFLTWGLSDDDSVVAMQLVPAAVVFVVAVLDLQFRTPALSPVREYRECQLPITLILPSLVWRTINWCTCCAWIACELWGGAVDLPAVVLHMHCAGDCGAGIVPRDDCTPGAPLRAGDLGPLALDALGPSHQVTTDDLRMLLRPIAIGAPILLFVNGLLCFWAWQYLIRQSNLLSTAFDLLGR